MTRTVFFKFVIDVALVWTVAGTGACGLPDPPQKNAVIPPDYAVKHMPEGWWNDEATIEEGRHLYTGKIKSTVNCARCHGKNGKPVKGGARDFRSVDTMQKYSDSHLLWRISEGVPFTQMRAYKSKLSEEEMWKIIAFLSTLGMSGYQFDAAKGAWVPYETG